MQLNRLYKITKTGSIQICDIKTLNEVLTVVFGLLEGKKQTKTTNCEPTNVGKSNERTATQQAVFQAKALSTKKIKAGYSLEPTGASEVKLAMKIGVYDSTKLQLPIYSDFKLNGVNGIYKLENNVLNLYSRSGGIYHSIPHLEADIRQIMTKCGCKELNGELYIHGEALQDIVSAVKKPKDLSKKLQFYIFDLPDINGDFKYRRKVLDLVIGDTVPSKLCKSELDVEEHFKLAIEQGYEGTVLKQPNSKYRYNIRSREMVKYKPVLTAEFKIASHNVDKNKEVVWVMQVGDKTFKCKPKGTREYRQQLAIEATTHYGEYWEIEYEMLSKDNIPLKGVALHSRETINGEAIN